MIRLISALALLGAFSWPRLGFADGGAVPTCNGNAWDDVGCGLAFVFLYAPLIFFLAVLLLTASVYRVILLFEAHFGKRVSRIKTYRANILLWASLAGVVTLASISTGTVVHHMLEFLHGYALTVAAMFGAVLLYALRESGWEGYKRLKAESEPSPPRS